jgi:hypothetical protein
VEPGPKKAVPFPPNGTNGVSEEPIGAIPPNVYAGFEAAGR